MGLRDILTGRSRVKGPAPDRLFAITTAYVTLQAEHGIETSGSAAIVFQSLATSEFQQGLREMEEVVKATGGDTGTRVTSEDDNFGYRWMILRDPDVEDLAVGINGVSSSIESGGHGERLLCAVFAFHDQPRSGSGSGSGQRIYLIYNYKRGYWYPFVPTSLGGAAQPGERSTERELQLKAQLAGDLPIEPEIERWFPLWGIPI